MFYQPCQDSNIHSRPEKICLALEHWSWSNLTPFTSELASPNPNLYFLINSVSTSSLNFFLACSMAHYHAQSAGTPNLKPTLHLNLLRGGRRAAIHGGVILPAINTNQRHLVVQNKQRCTSLEPTESAAVADYEISVKNNVRSPIPCWIVVYVTSFALCFGIGPDCFIAL